MPISGSDLFIGDESSGLLKTVGPETQILLKKLDDKPGGDGTKCTADDSICIVKPDVHRIGSQDVFGSRTLLRGDPKRGNLKIKVDTCDRTQPSVPCRFSMSAQRGLRPPAMRPIRAL